MIFTHKPFTAWADKITQRFGANPEHYPTACGHEGVDFSVKVGEPIMAMHSGRVRLSELQDAYGEVVVIELNAYETTYAHLSERRVEVGQLVKAGEVIGLGGNTGRSTGAHLHIGLRVASWSYGGACNGYSNPEHALMDLFMSSTHEEET